MGWYADTIGPDADGYIVYTPDGFVSVSIMKRRRMPFQSNDVLAGTRTEKIEAASGYRSYGGSCEVVDNQVTHHVESGVLSPLHPAQVSFRTHQEDEVRLWDLSVHPHRPPGRRRGLILVDQRINEQLMPNGSWVIATADELLG